MTLNIPNTFSAGTKAIAEEVNENFTACKNAIDSNAISIANNTSTISTNTINIRTTEAAMSANSIRIEALIGNTSTLVTNVKTDIVSAINEIKNNEFQFTVKEVLTGFSSGVEYQATKNGILSCYAGGNSNLNQAYIQVGEESGSLEYKVKDYDDECAYCHVSYPITINQYFIATATGNWETKIEFIVL